MSEHIHVHETPPNPEAQVPSPSATAYAMIYSAMRSTIVRSREGEVEQDTILGDRIPDGQGGCQRSTDSPSSYRCSTSFRFEQGTLPRAQLALWGLLLSSLTFVWLQFHFQAISMSTPQ